MSAFQDRFSTTKLGNLFMMRLAAFLRERNARLLDINETSARIELGGRTIGDWFFGREYVERTHIDLSFQESFEAASADPTKRLDVDVNIRPAGLGSGEFPQLAQYLMRDLRGFFAAV